MFIKKNFWIQAYQSIGRDSRSFVSKQNSNSLSRLKTHSWNHLVISTSRKSRKLDTPELKCNVRSVAARIIDNTKTTKNKRQITKYKRKSRKTCRKNAFIRFIVKKKQAFPPVSHVCSPILDLPATFNVILVVLRRCFYVLFFWTSFHNTLWMLVIWVFLTTF